MKVTVNWLKQYVDFDWPIDELVERLTMLGMEVEGVEELTDPLEGVVVAEVLQKDQHPNADKLSVCRVADGSGERQIVCGAKNFVEGDKVPLILPGASLPTEPGEKPFVIKVGKLRGVESQGMMCSPKELKLADDADGLMILPREAAVGTPLSEHLGKATGDTVIDLEITPNRPDLNSVIGVAREIAALTGAALRLPDAQPAESDFAASDWVDVRIEDSELCPRYSARVLRGVRVGPSPDWLRESLEKVGLRSVNNVVDVTNFVMLEFGQPLHAFDYHLLQKTDGADRPTIVVRRAADGDTFTTLDEQERTISSETLVIADEQRPVALAGVMGGMNTEIRDETTDVLLESATFSATNIRRTSKTLGLRTDASYRYERGADPEVVELASRRAVALILETAGGELASGIVDAYPAPWAPQEIPLRFGRTDALLGMAIPASQQAGYLQALGFQAVGAVGDEEATFTAPSFRVDIKGEIDLIEEVTRMYGVNEIPSTTPRGAQGEHKFDSVFDDFMQARQILTGLGFHEAQGQTLIASESARLMDPNPIPLSYPLSSDMDAMRPSLIPGLLDCVAINIARNNDAVALFEIGRVFTQGDEGAKEEWRVAMALTGRAAPIFWDGAERDRLFDAGDIKGAVEEFLEAFGCPALQVNRLEDNQTLFVQSAEFALGKRKYGVIGQLHPILGKRYDLRHPVFMAELSLDSLFQNRRRGVKTTALPTYPSSRRDIALQVAESLTHQEIARVVSKAKVANLVGVELFDVFRGKNIPDGQKSVAYQFTYRRDDRTLTDKEVNDAHEKLVKKLTAELGATTR